MKGNLFLGMARGSVGDVVFARQKGQQTARARNRQPNNPRTTKQMSNRAKIATMVRFFSRSRQNLFNYAFEGKKGNQSDYNAFVSINSKNSPTNSFLAISQQWPMIGEFFVSQGSLSTPTVAFDSGQRNPALKLKPLAQSVLPSAYTIGQLSQQLIDTYSYQNGDYLTFVAIRSQAQPAQTLEDAIEYKALTSRVINAEWQIKQMQVDTNSNALVSSLGIFVFPGTTADTMATLQYLDNSNAYAAPYVFGTTVVTSRVMTDNKVKTSTSQIITNAATHTACEIGKSLAWRTWVGENWEEQEQELLKANDILKGSISENDVNFNMPVVVSLNGTTVYNGQTVNERGTLNLNSYGYYNVSDIELYVNDAKWTATSVSENSLTYNVQSNGHFIFKVGKDIIFSFYVRNEQDFSIDGIFGYNTEQNNVPGSRVTAGTFAQRENYQHGSHTIWVKSTGVNIQSLEPTASGGVTVTKQEKASTVDDTYVKLQFNDTDAVAPVTVFLGNVLVYYITSFASATSTATAFKAATRKASKA